MTGKRGYLTLQAMSFPLAAQVVAPPGPRGRMEDGDDGQEEPDSV